MASFTVYVAQEGRHHAHVLEGSSFEDAALAFTQMWRPAMDQESEADHALRLRVIDRDTGDQQCFVIDLGAPDQIACS